MATFDGVNKLIILGSGTTSLSVQELYSEWIDWLSVSDNSKFLLAFRTSGGDPISDTKSTGITYFLTNGWRIRPYEGNHRLLVTGNVYTDPAGSSPFVQTLGSYNVMVETTVSNISDAITVETGSAVTQQDKLDITSMILNGSVDTLTLKQSLQAILSVIAGKSAGGNTNEVAFRDIGDTKNRIVATIDESGNRIAVTISPD